MPRIRVHRRDHPIRSDPPRDAEHPVGVAVEVLADHAGQQPRGLVHLGGQLTPVQRRHQRYRVAGQRVHQRRPRPRIVVVAHRFSRAGVVVVAAQHCPQLGLQLRLGDPQQPADRRTDQRDRVHRGHRVIQRGRIQHPLTPHQPRRLGRLQSDLEDPIRPRRAGQPGAHVHQHGVHKPRIIEIQPAGGVLPARVERESLHRLPIRQSLDPLQHHHHRHDHRRHAAPTHIGEQIGEHLIREQVEALPMQHTVNRVRRHPVLAEIRRRPQQIRLNRRPSQRHPLIQLEQPRSAGHRHAKNTTHPGQLRSGPIAPQRPDHPPPAHQHLRPHRRRTPLRGLLHQDPRPRPGTALRRRPAPRATRPPSRLAHPRPAHRSTTRPRPPTSGSLKLGSSVKALATKVRYAAPGTSPGSGGPSGSFGSPGVRGWVGGGWVRS